MSTQQLTNLPVATTNLEQAKNDLDAHGYALIENAMTPDEVSTALTRLKEQAEAERQQGIAYEDGGAGQNWGKFTDEEGNLRKDAFTAKSGGVNQRVWMLVNKGQIFRDLLGKKSIRAVIDHALGDDYLLSSYTANIAKPGGIAMNLHTDQWWMPDPIRREPPAVRVGSISREQPSWNEPEAPALIAPTACVNVMWMLADFTEENGGTRIVPGSHHTGVRPDNSSTIESIAATGKAGSAMVFDGRLWHGTGANVSNVNRYGLLTTFCGPIFRPQENFIVGTDPDILAEASEDLRALLGLKIWNGYGRVENPLGGFITRDEVARAEMRPE